MKAKAGAANARVHAPRLAGTSSGRVRPHTQPNRAARFACVGPRPIVNRSILSACLLIVVMAGGCPPGRSAGRVPPPLLPRTIRLHPFTGTRTFDDGGKTRGIEARVEAIDHFGDSTKAFGIFRFELCRHLPHRADPRGQRVSVWAVDLRDAEKNVQYWEPVSRTYKFPLAWGKPIPVGSKYVLRIILSLPDGPRLFDQRIFVSGQ